MKKRTKIIILSVMVLLLGVTGYLNVVLNNSIKNNSTTETTTTTASYFASYRQDRETNRERELAYYQAIVDSEPTDSTEASKAKDSMLNLLAQIEKELVVEGLIKGIGFEDCVMTMTPQNVNVVVKSNSLQESEVAQIVSILQSELSVSLENIKIMPVA